MTKLSSIKSKIVKGFKLITKNPAFKEDSKVRTFKHLNLDDRKDIKDDHKLFQKTIR